MNNAFFELSNPQNSIWVTEQFYSHTNINNICGIFNFNAKIDVEILKQSINLLVKQNDALRLRIILKDLKPMQYVADFEDFDIPVSLVSNEEDLCNLKQKMATDIIEVIDAPLFRFTIFQFPNGVGGYVVTVHHLASDALTLGLIGNKTYDIYEKLIHQEPIDDITFSYIDYLNSEKLYLSSEKFKKDETYWNELYSTIPEVATIPSIMENTKEDLHSAREVFPIYKEQTEHIRQYCKENKISLYHFFMSIFSLYIGRVSNLDDFVVGTPILNRTNFKEKNTLGMFISNLPFRVTIDSQKTFTEYATTIATQLTTMLRHQRYPYQYLLENLRKKDSSLPNLYNITLSYQITKASALGSGCSTDWIPADNIADDMQIHFYDLDYNGNINIAYDYRTYKYDKEEIINIQKRIEYIIEQVLVDDNLIMKNIEIVTPEEKRQILYEFNNTKTDYPNDKTIVQLFEEQAEKTPDNIALVFEDKKLTYKELNEKSNALAHYLINNGVKNNDVIALFMDKSLEIIISILSTLKCGCTYLPIDIDYPEERISFMLKDSNAKMILTTSSHINTLHTDYFTICVDSFDFSKNTSNNPILINNNANSLAYIMYTSGSTGTPKGVMISNKNVVRLVKNTNYIKFEKGDRILQTGSIVFDACTFEIWGALLNGLELYLLKKEDLLNPLYFSNYLKEHKISSLFLTTALFNKFCEENAKMFNGLKYLLTGGEAVSIKHMEMAKIANPHLNLVHVYGPTENTTFSTYYPVTSISTTIPIGFPIANSTCYVVSKDGILQPIGTPGELWVGGDGVGIGYLNREDLTLEKFINNPFSEGTLYKTGDLVKILPDGSIDFIGRIDNQVKIRGFRIELSGIDSQILSFPNIKECITVIQTVASSKTICSYFVSDKDISINELKIFLSQVLPSYMVPTYIIPMEQLPLNINGKIDKKSLPLPSAENHSATIVPSRNELDSTILDALSEVLHIDNISIEDSFVNLGGDSLTAINLCIKLSNTLNLSITVKDILKFPVIKDLSDYIASLNNTENTAPIQKAELSDSYPVSSAQKRMYYSSTIDGANSILYNIAGGVILNKVPNIEKLENCFRTLINRHESLRTYFDIIDGNVVQKIKDDVKFTLDFSEKQYSSINDAYNNFIKPFDLKNAPLFRAKLVLLPDNKASLLLDMHHSISDGSSLAILVQELCSLYNNSKLSEKTIDYKDFAVWENNNLSSDYFNDAKEFWVNQFKNDIPILDMPLSNARPSMQSFEGANIYTEFNEDLTLKINTLAHKLNVTPYMLLLSIYYILLYKYSSNTDIVVGTPISARDNSEITNIVGMFVNTLALRQKIDPSLSFTDFLNGVKEYCLNAFKYQTYPFDELLHNLDIKRDTSRNPLFDTMFIYQNNGYPEVNFDGINATYFIPDNNISKFDLSLEVLPENNIFKLRFEYCTKLFDKDFIIRLSDHYTNILKTILENNTIKIADIDMLSQEEKHQILYDFNNTKMDYPRDKNLVDLFTDIVNKQPDKSAVSYESTTISYFELDQKSTYLSRLLLAKGIKCGDVVGVCLSRSIELLISIWAILKTGAVYMPMYTHYPKDRLNYMLENSNARLLITNSILDTYIGDNIEKLIVNNFNDITNYSVDIKIDVDILPNNLAYIIYTSGSTGKPKGVQITHQNLINFIYAFNNYFKDINFKDRFLASTNISFDVSIWELFLSILNGAELVLYNENIISDIINYCNYIKNREITCLYIPPNILEEVYSVLQSYDDIKISKILVGVEPIKKSTLNKYYALNPNLQIVNGYGPTETTICATSLVYTKEELNENHFISIGHPLHNNNIYILNSDKQLQPIGIEGELCITGVGVGAGYINNPQENNKNFVENTFDNNSETMYKTGDLAAWNSDGTIKFIGRKDNQIKISGYRIELQEIDNTILTYPYISKALSTTKTINGNLSIVSYFVSDNNIITDDLVTYLQEKLPFYMIPSFFVQLPELPLTPNGKIDQKKLPLPKLSSNTVFVAPKNKFQETLSNIFCELFNMEKVSINDNFFELGGDSLTAIKLQTEALKFGININYSDIFTYPTIALLSNKNSKNPLYDIDTSYDYSTINEILSRNIPQNISTSNKLSDNNFNILLLGATGFLGAHILDSFLSNNKGKIYCLVRKKGLIDPEERLKQILNFYFENKYNTFFGNRIIVVYGDISYENLNLNHNDITSIKNDIRYVVNSAAMVKHFGDFKTFHTVNVIGTKNIINFCKDFDKKLYHISTTSVSGIGANHQTITNDLERVVFDETKFYINQNLDNTYVYTKFEAEKMIFEEISHGLNACILRVGNIVNRYSDGKFQMNPNENAFINRLKSLLNLGAIEKKFLSHSIDFTPVDYCANAITAILQYNPDFTVFHLINTNFITCVSLIEILNSIGYNLNIVDSKNFSELINQYLNNNRLKNKISGIIPDLDSNKQLAVISHALPISNFTTQYLNSIGFYWPIIDEDYIKKYINYFKLIKYLD